MLTGESQDHQLTIIVSLPSLEKIDEWCASNASRPLVALREEGANVQTTSYEVMP